MTDLR